jgi:hypothetical protein
VLAMDRPTNRSVRALALFLAFSVAAPSAPAASLYCPRILERWNFLGLPVRVVEHIDEMGFERVKGFQFTPGLMKATAGLHLAIEKGRGATESFLHNGRTITMRARRKKGTSLYTIVVGSNRIANPKEAEELLRMENAVAKVLLDKTDPSKLGAIRFRQFMGSAIDGKAMLESFGFQKASRRFCGKGNPWAIYGAAGMGSIVLASTIGSIAADTGGPGLTPPPSDDFIRENTVPGSESIETSLVDQPTETTTTTTPEISRDTSFANTTFVLDTVETSEVDKEFENQVRESKSDETGEEEDENETFDLDSLRQEPVVDRRPQSEGDEEYRANREERARFIGSLTGGGIAGSGFLAFCAIRRKRNVEYVWEVARSGTKRKAAVRNAPPKGTSPKKAPAKKTAAKRKSAD